MTSSRDDATMSNTIPDRDKKDKKGVKGLPVADLAKIGYYFMAMINAAGIHRNEKSFSNRVWCLQIEKDLEDIDK